MLNLLNKAKICAWRFHFRRRVRCEAFEMHLVNKQLVEVEIGRSIVLPVKRAVVDDDSLRRESRRVADVLHELAPTWMRLVGEQQIVRILELAAHCLRVGIKY